MNRKKEIYDRQSVGGRIQKRRKSLGLSQEQLAERMDRATKYCSDIERGACGMSVETMLGFSEHLDMSLDYMMFGKGEQPDSITPINTTEQTAQSFERQSAYLDKLKKESET